MPASRVLAPEQVNSSEARGTVNTPPPEVFPVTGIRKYTNADYPLLQDWYKARKQVCPPRASLSDMGWIADGRVAGFLYITPSDVCIIEGMVADPNTVPSLRQESLHKLSGFLVDWAVALGYKNIIAITEHPGIEAVCERLGFRPIPHKVYSLRTDPSESI